MEIPELYLDYAREQLPYFVKGSAGWELIEKCLCKAEAVGIQRDDSLTLLMSLTACEQWIHDPIRKSRLKDEQAHMDFTRPVSKSKFGHQSHEAAKETAREYTEARVQEVEAFIALGFVQRIGQSKVRIRDWSPLLPALTTVFGRGDDKDDPEINIFEMIRQRVRRLKKNTFDEPADVIATNYFESLYATLWA